MLSELNQVKFSRSGTVAVATLNNPRHLNALSNAVMDEMERVFEHVEEDGSVRALVITGEGRAFCAGADITELTTDPSGSYRYLQRSLQFLSRPERCPKVVVAAVNGYALGGGMELALACDFIVAANTARFATPEPRLGVVPAFAMIRLPMLVPLPLAREVLILGRELSAEDARSVGLVAAVSPLERLLPDAIALAGKAADAAPLALELLKSALNRRFHHEDLLFAQEANARLFATTDAQRGIAAFLAKEVPAFEGR